MSIAQERTARRFWPTEVAALCIAAAWSVALIVGAVTVPFYSSSVSDQTSSGAVHHPSASATFVQVNGLDALLIVAVPLLITVSVFGLLWRRSIERSPGPVAWTIVGLLGALTLAGVLTIGMLILPVTACLVAACGVRQVRHRPG